MPGQIGVRPLAVHRRANSMAHIRQKFALGDWRLRSRLWLGTGQRPSADARRSLAVILVPLQIDNSRGTDGIWLFAFDGQPAVREGHLNDRPNHQTVIFLELVSLVMGVVAMQVRAIDRSRRPAEPSQDLDVMALRGG